MPFSAIFYNRRDDMNMFSFGFNRILFSAYLDAEVRARAKELGILACVAKTELSRIPDALWRHGTD